MDPEARFLDNMLLVHHVIKRHFDLLMFDEDTVQVGRVGLWKACLSYDESKDISFSSYAYTCILNEIRMEGRKLHRKGKDKVIVLHYDDLISTECDSSFIELVEDPNDYYILVETKMMLDSLNDREKRVVYLSSLGMDQRAIGRELGLSQSYVSRLLRQVRTKLSAAG